MVTLGFGKKDVMEGLNFISCYFMLVKFKKTRLLETNI